MKKAVSSDIPVEIWRLANTTLENERISQEWRRHVLIHGGMLWREEE